MNKPSKTVTTIGVVAFVIAAAVTGLSAIPGTAWSGFVNPVLLFIGVFLGVFLLGYILDRAAKNAAGGGARRRRAVDSAPSRFGPSRSPRRGPRRRVGRAGRAASGRRQVRDEPAEHAREARAGGRARLEDLLVAQRLARVARAGVRHEAHPADLEARPSAPRSPRAPSTCRRRRRPSCAASAPRPGSRTPGRSARRRRPPRASTPSALGRRRGGVIAEARRPDVGQVGEAWAELVRVRPQQRRPAGEVEVVADDHQRARAVGRVHAAGGVGRITTSARRGA